MSRKTLLSFLRDRSANVATVFAFAMIPIVMFIAAAVDYGGALRSKTRLQLAADEAALSIVTQVASNVSPAQAIQNAVNQIAAQSGVQLSAGQYPVYCSAASCSATYKGQTVTLSSGQAAVTVSSTQPRLLWNASNIPLSASSIARAQIGAVSVKFQFQYAKGQFYKVVTLHATPNGAAAPVTLATWTYQATNWSATADPASPPPYFTVYTSEQGVGTVSLTCTSYAVISGGSCSDATLASSPTLDLTNFSNPYLTMLDAGYVCPPGTTFDGTSQAITGFQQSWYTHYYSSATGSPNQNVTCTGTPSTNVGDYWRLETTNSQSYSDYLYLDGVQQPANTIIPFVQLFPCPASGATNTVYHSWEDFSYAANTNRDFYFAVTVTCGAVKNTGALRR